MFAVVTGSERTQLLAWRVHVRHGVNFFPSRHREHCADLRSANLGMDCREYEEEEEDAAVASYSHSSQTRAKFCRLALLQRSTCVRFNNAVLVMYMQIQFWAKWTLQTTATHVSARLERNLNVD